MTELWTDLSTLDTTGPPAEPRATVCRRTDGQGIFYPGNINGLEGHAGAMRVLTAATVIDVLRDVESTAAYLDLGGTPPQETVRRLLAYGAPLTVLANPARFRLHCPDAPEDIGQHLQSIHAMNPTVLIAVDPPVLSSPLLWRMTRAGVCIIAAPLSGPVTTVVASLIHVGLPSGSAPIASRLGVETDRCGDLRKHSDGNWTLGTLTHWAMESGRRQWEILPGRADPAPDPGTAAP